MSHPIAFHAKMMDGIMYFHQEICQHDGEEFVNSIVEEITGHVNAKQWKLIKQSDVPEGVDIVTSVWTMQCKHDLTINDVMKHKARLNLHSGKQQFGSNYLTHMPLW